MGGCLGTLLHGSIRAERRGVVAVQAAAVQRYVCVSHATT